MRLNQLFALAAVASVLTQPALASNHRPTAAPPASVAAGPKMCRLFDSPHLDNQGFVVACDKQAPNTTPTVRLCPMFNPPTPENAGFRVPCEKEAAPAFTPQRTCPMFNPPTLDNMGFRVPC